MVGSCLFATNGSCAALSNELRSASASGQNSAGLVDELQLMNLQALSGASALVLYAFVVTISSFR